MNVYTQTCSVFTLLTCVCIYIHIYTPTQISDNHVERHDKQQIFKKAYEIHMDEVSRLINVRILSKQNTLLHKCA